MLRSHGEFLCLSPGQATNISCDLRNRFIHREKAFIVRNDSTCYGHAVKYLFQERNCLTLLRPKQQTKLLNMQADHMNNNKTQAVRLRA